MKTIPATVISGKDGSFYNSLGMEISRNAYFALMAASMRARIGRWAAMRYCLNRGVPLSLYRLACQLQAVSI